ncbi:hypothetical protein RRF57_009984 [Xylaria bambusicola]|uniref:Uncharacterized protein n=1 Tax=Xylaria bambusicola TaxID=326684 RepID=A0AAN7UKI8_9PEZI
MDDNSVPREIRNAPSSIFVGSLSLKGVTISYPSSRHRDQEWELHHSDPFYSPKRRHDDDDEGHSPYDTLFTVPCRSRAYKIMSMMDRHLHNNDLKDLAKVFITYACPGDLLQRYDDLIYLNTLLKIIDPMTCDSIRPVSSGGRAIDVYESIVFRLDLCDFVQFILQKFGLSKPDDEYCLFWDNTEQNLSYNESNYSRWHNEVMGKLRAGGFPFLALEEQGPLFERPLHYLSTAITNTQLDDKAQMVLVHEICQFVREVEQYHHSKLTQRENSDDDSWLGPPVDEP